MDNENRTKRPTDRGRTTVSRERPLSQARRPQDARPRTGRASERPANSDAQRAPRRTREEQKTRQAEAQAWARELLDRQEEARREAGTQARTRAGEAPSNRSSRAADPDRRARAAEPQRRRVPRDPEVPETHRTRRTPDPEAPAPARKKKKPHRIYNTNLGLKIAIMLAVVAVIVLSMLIFFKVKHIDVIFQERADGLTHYYTAEEIIAASGISLDDNLLSLSKATAASKIHAEKRYINEIQIKKELPGTVIITVSEFEVTYAIQDVTGGWWLMSREGRILDQVTEQEARTHMRITGLPIELPKLGEPFEPAVEEGADLSEIAAKERVVLEVIPALEAAAFTKELDRVDVSTSYDLTLWWKNDTFEIKLGTIQDLDYKLRFLRSAVESPELQNRSGTIDLTFNEDDKVHFLEFR